MISTHSPAHTHSAFFPVTIHSPSVLPTKAVPSLVHWIPSPLKFPQSFKPPLSLLFHWVILDHSKQHKFMPFSLLFKNKTNKMYKWGFPGGTVDKNLHAKAGETGSIPGPGRFHMSQPLSLGSRDWEPQLLKAICLNKRSRCKEEPATAMEHGPHMTQLEKAHGQQWKPRAAINQETNK